MPVGFVRLDGTTARVVASVEPFWIGRSVDCHLVLADPRVRRRHARLRYLKGDYVLSATEDAGMFVNGARVPLMPLRDGDEVAFTEPEDPHPLALRFSNRMEGTFVPAGASLVEAWANHPASRDPAVGSAQFGPGEPFGNRDAAVCRRVEAADRGGSLVVKVLGPARSVADGERHLRTLTAIGGAPHPALALLVDGGLESGDRGLDRWIATRFEVGQSAADLVRIGGLDAGAVLYFLRTLSGGLARLHARGIVHRDVSPGNVLVRPDGSGVLIDYGTALPWEDGVPPSKGVIGTPGYLAPEEVLEGGSSITPAVDVYGLAAVGYALLTGQPPASGDDVLAVLSGALTAPPKLATLGLSVPDAMESALLEALSPHAPERPSARALQRALSFAEAQLGLGGRT